MKTLTIGFLFFACWATLSTWIYVCKIKGLCKDTESGSISTLKLNDAYTSDSLSNTLATKAEMPDNQYIYFAFDKSAFASDSDLTGFSDASTSYMSDNSQAVILITGHTDAIGSDNYNQDLGYRRAQSVQKYFEGKGIPAEKIIIDSKGEKEPAEDNNTDAGRAKNRRAIVTIKK